MAQTTTPKSLAQFDDFCKRQQSRLRESLGIAQAKRGRPPLPDNLTIGEHGVTRVTSDLTLTYRR